MTLKSTFYCWWVFTYLNNKFDWRHWTKNSCQECHLKQVHEWWVTHGSLHTKLSSDHIRQYNVRLILPPADNTRCFHRHKCIVWSSTPQLFLWSLNLTIHFNSCAHSRKISLLVRNTADANVRSRSANGMLIVTQ